MSDYHIGLKPADNKTCQVYIHLPISDAQTVAGTALNDLTRTYQKSIAETLPLDENGNPIYSRISDLVDAGELTDLQNGVKFEKEITFRFSSTDLTNVQRRNEIENGNDNDGGKMIGVYDGVGAFAGYMTQIVTPGSDVWNEILEPREWWGYHRTV